MTVYCPNCGKPNTDEANACASCGTQLTKPGVRKAGKFKGTMMMAGVTAPTPPAAGAGPGAPPSGDAPQQPAKKDLAFQQTMLGPMTPPPGQPGAPQGGGASGGGFGAAGGDGAPGSAPGGSAPGGSAPGGGFGAPPGGSAPGGGFGAPPGGSAPGGGFGAPPGGSAPGGSAPGGGFGPPPGGSAPGGPPPGGFGGSPAGPGGPPGGGSKAKLWLGIGIGCLLIIILGCVGGWYYWNRMAKRYADGLLDVQNRWAITEELSYTLVRIQMNCDYDPTGAGNSNFFHPQVASQYAAASCQVNDQTLTAFSNDCSYGDQPPCSNVTVAAGTPDESRATALGLDPQTCHVVTSGSAKLVACWMGEDLKLIHVENLAAVQ